jgi:heme-degrading monooxygenase HmoA
MWDVRGERGSATHRANMRTLKETYEALRGQIPGLLTIEVGLDFSAIDYACDVVLVSEFESLEALQTYQQHPAHLAARKHVGDLRIARHQVDYFL